MRKFLALLLLIPAQLFAQTNPAVPTFSIDYTATQSPSSIPLEMLNQNQGIALNLGDDAASGIINLGFSFYYYDKEFTSIRISNNGVASLGQLTINGCCGGYNLSSPGNEYGIFGIQTDLINIQTMNPYYRFFDEEGPGRFVIGWYNMPIFYDGNFRSTFELTLFEGTNDILINFGDISNGNRFFTAGIKGSNALGFDLIYSGTNGNTLDFTSWFFDPQLSVQESLSWSKIAEEWGSFILTTPSEVRYGANGVWVSKTLFPGVYGCDNGFFGDPIGGVVKSCEIGSPTAATVDCSTDPGNAQCVILAATSTTSSSSSNDGTSDTDTFASTGSDDGSSDGTEIESTADSSNDAFMEELEEQAVASNENDEEEVSTSSDELTDEENAETESEAQVLAENNDRELENKEVAEKLVDKIDPSVLSLVLSIVESTSQVDNSGATAGQSSATGPSTSSAAAGSLANINQAAGVVASTTSTDSSSDSSVISASGDPLSLGVDSVTGQTAAAAAEVVNQLEAETLKAVQASTQSAFTDNSAFDQSESTEFTVNTLDPNNPANQFFNNMPSIANQEAAGVLKSNNDDKSDAEKRAEEVVAANAKEQEEISKNYMDADQSGIVAAMGSDTDFTSYRNAMLQDASAWYKPEDIYKNIVIKDNVRGSYFLEKGSTDTYKKMVEEQYK